mmetsp:Transcript_9764/g.16441  ORF Transcript_9764/g.16441 Transcript_9764/m.16441 type:complete len:151 (-) Transcript_9764:290-742(-)
MYQDGKKRYGYSEQGKPSAYETLFISLRANFVTMLATTPMWTVKTRMVLFQERRQDLKSPQILRQVLQDMVDNGGIRTFYRGLTPSLLMSLYGFIQMYSYELMTYLFGFQTGQMKTMSWENMLIPFVVGGVSKSLAACTFLPVSVIRMRL